MKKIKSSHAQTKFTGSYNKRVYILKALDMLILLPILMLTHTQECAINLIKAINFKFFCKFYLKGIHDSHRIKM